MARNALVIAMVILDGSNATTEPLRRITLYCAKRGSAPLTDRTARLSHDQVPRWDRGRAGGGERWRCAWAFLLYVSCRCVRVCVAIPRGAGICAQRPVRRGIPRGGDRCRLRPSPVAWGLSGERPSESACKSESTISCVQVPDSTPSIVGRAQAPQAFFMHRKGAQKRQEKQPSAAIPAAYPRAIHRLSTALSTASGADERWRGRCRFATVAGRRRGDRTSFAARQRAGSRPWPRSGHPPAARRARDPVKLPNAGRIARLRPSTKQGSRSAWSAGPCTVTPGCTWPHSA